jgi:hypothetical protein
VPAEIEQVLHSGMGANKSLRLPHRFEFSHPPFPDPGNFMGLRSPIVLILFGTVDGLWH